jgi:hypothetical protein
MGEKRGAVVNPQIKGLHPIEVLQPCTHQSAQAGWSNLTTGGVNGGRDAEHRQQARLGDR